jgi:Molybdopterin converting factor, small subunit
MNVEVRIFGGLHRFTGGRTECNVAISQETRAWDMVRALGIPEHEVWFVAVNGVRAPQEQALSAGDKVDIFAPVGGG